MSKRSLLLLCVIPVFALVDTVNGVQAMLGLWTEVNVGQFAKIILLLLLLLSMQKNSWKWLLGMLIPLLSFFLATVLINPISMSSLLLNAAFIAKILYIFIVAAAYFPLVGGGGRNTKNLFIVLLLALGVYLLNISLGAMGIGTSQYTSFGFKGFIISGNELSAAIFAYLSLLLLLLVENRTLQKKTKMLFGLLGILLTFLISLLLATKTLLLGIMLCAVYFLYAMQGFDIRGVLEFVKKQRVVIILVISLIGIFSLSTPNISKVFIRTVSIGQRDGVLNAILGNRNRYVVQYVEVWKRLRAPAKVLGIGVQPAASYKMMEIDLLDLIFFFGLGGVVYFGLWVARIFYGIRVTHKTPTTRYFIFVNVVLLLISIFAGHVVYSTIVAVPLGILWALYYSGPRGKLESADLPVLLWVGSTRKGGIRTYMLSISEQLQKVGFVVRVVNSHNYFFIRPVWEMCMTLFHAKVLSQRRVIIHYHMATKGSFVRKFILATLFWPFADAQILHLHGGGTPDFMNAVLRFPFSRQLLQFFFHRFDKIISVSEPLQKEVFEVFEKNNFRLAERTNWNILHNAIAVPKTLVKPKVFSTGSTLKILFVGRFEKEKNLPAIVSIARQLKSNNVNAHITLIGDGSLSGQIKEQIKAGGLEDYLTLGGWVNYDKIDRVYQEHHLFLIPSLHESFGIVVLEAYKNGLAALASTAGGLKEIVINEVTGYTFDARDVDGFVAKIEYLVEHPEVLAKFRHNAQEFVRGFDYEMHIKELRKIVEV